MLLGDQGAPSKSLSERYGDSTHLVADSTLLASKLTYGNQYPVTVSLLITM